jgi:hypothetical protein
MNDSPFSFATEKIDEQAVDSSNLICLPGTNSRQKKRLNRRLSQAYWIGKRLQVIADFIDKKTA